MKMNEGALEYSKEIVQSVAILTDKTQDILVFASDGTWATDRRVNTRALINVVASDGRLCKLLVTTMVSTKVWKCLIILILQVW